MDTVLLEILALIRCPEKRVPLRAAEPAELERLNAAIRAGTLTNVGGATVDEPLESALVREGNDLAYPIRHDIPILIVEEGLPLDQSERPSS